MQAWNYITQPNAKMVAENMYKGSNSVGSYLVDSQAWNHICSNIFKVGTDTSIDSTNYGNYLNNKTFITKPGTLWTRHVSNNEQFDIAKNYTTDDVQHSNQSETTCEYTELATGSSDDFKKYNIYDMAGNMWEWTTSHLLTPYDLYFVTVGGSYGESGLTDSVAHTERIQ